MLRKFFLRNSERNLSAILHAIVSFWKVLNDRSFVTNNLSNLDVLKAPT